MPLPPPADCPCGTGERYDRCCGPLHAGLVHADTAEALMRSRYSAYVRGAHDHLLRTWHPRTRPSRIDTQQDVAWTALEIVEIVGGGPQDEHGVVAFTARFRDGTASGQMSERSAFERRAGRWVYVGEADPTDASG